MELYLRFSRMAQEINSEYVDRVEAFDVDEELAGRNREHQSER